MSPNEMINVLKGTTVVPCRRIYWFGFILLMLTCLVLLRLFILPQQSWKEGPKIFLKIIFQLYLNSFEMCYILE